MNKKALIIFSGLLIFILIGCAAPPESVETETDALRQVESVTTVPQVEEGDDGPVATAVIIVDSDSSNEGEVESYPEPENLFAPTPYPYPEPTPLGDEAEPEAAATDLSGLTGEGDVEVVFVSARSSGEDSWNFAVTLEHEDTGWEDYADGWDVILPDGTVIKPNADSPFTRLLLHPHENEQPFTRNQNGIIIPADVTTVYVRGHELVEGYGSMLVEVDLTAESGDRFEVVR
ncbi:MAG: hypothetical protein AAF902_11295 [Chloroflexota bacterium]